MGIHEQILAASAEEIDDLMYGSKGVMVVDHRSEEPEVAQETQNFITGFTFTHQYDGEGGVTLEMNYQNRSATKFYGPEIAYHCFRVILDIRDLVRPDVDVRVWEPSLGSDTHIFLIADSDYWSRFERESSADKRNQFIDAEALISAWELDNPQPAPDYNKLLRKKWWQFWK